MGDPASPLREEIARLCRAWADAIVSRDAAAADEFMAEDFVFTSERGRWGKARFLANLTRWDAGGAMAFRDVEVRDLGHVAAMFARVALRVRLDGREMAGEAYVTDIWARRDGEWRVVSRQWSWPTPTGA